MKTTREKLIAVFAEWNRRYLENPENFSVLTFDDDEAMTSADYLIKIHEELFPHDP